MHLKDFKTSIKPNYNRKIMFFLTITLFLNNALLVDRNMRTLLKKFILYGFECYLKFIEIPVYFHLLRFITTPTKLVLTSSEGISFI